MDRTMNSGFWASERRAMNGRGARERREKEVLRTLSIRGVGRTGRGPPRVPAGLAMAVLGGVESVDEGLGS